MADNTVIKEPAPTFDLGIENSIVYGNLEAADSFLSGKEVTSSSEEIEKIEPKTKTIEKKEPEKKEPEKKVPASELINNFLTDEEPDTEEPDTEEEEITSPTKEVAPKETPGSKEDNTFQALSESLYEAGVFTTEEGEDPEVATTPEEFLELFNKEKTKGVSTVLENFLSRHGEDRRELFDAIFVKGVDPSKYLPVFNEVQNFENLDLEQEANQEKAIRTYYTRAGWDKAKVDTKIEKLKNYAELEEEAKNVHPLLVQQDKEALTNMEQEAAQVQAEKVEEDKIYKNSISKLLQEKVKTKDFDGLPIDEKTAAKAFDFLYTKKWKLPSGELLTDFDKTVLESKNPDNISGRIKMALLYLNNFDLTKVQKKAITKESNNLFNKLVKKETITKKAPEHNNTGW